MRNISWLIAASCALLLTGYFGYRSFQLNTQPCIVAFAGVSGGQWKGNMMTIAEYERSIESEDGLNKSLDRLYPGMGLQDASRKKLMAAKSRASNQTLLALLFAGVAGLLFFRAFGGKEESPEAAAEASPL